MNINFEAALQYIDLGNNEKAIEYLQKAIDQELEAGKEINSMEYRCVLGELYGNMGMEEHARREFEQVVDFCDATSTLPKQRLIAKTSLDFFDGRLPELPDGTLKKRNPSAPIVPKPVQDKAFITRRMNRRK